MMVSVDKGSFGHRHTNRENQSREERDQARYGQIRGPKITCQMEKAGADCLSWSLAGALLLAL